MAQTFDTLGQLNGDSPDRAYLEYLKSINDAVQKLVKQSGDVSQSAARNSIPRRDEYYAAQSLRNSGSHKRGFNRYNTHNASRRTVNMIDDFFDSFERELIESIVGSDFRDHMSRSLRGVASMMGVELQDVPKELGKNLGRTVVNVFNQTDFGRNVTTVVNDIQKQAMASTTARFKNLVDSRDGTGSAWGRFMDGYSSNVDKSSSYYSASNTTRSDQEFHWETVNVVAENVVVTRKETDKSLSTDENKFDQVGEMLPDVVDSLDGPLSALMTDVPKLDAAISTVGGSSTELVGSMTSLSTATAGATAGGVSLGVVLGTAAIALGAVVVGLVLLDKVVDALGPSIEGTKQLFDKMSDTANRHQKSRERYIELAQKRLVDDIEAMIEEPFNILKDAANEVYNAWDSNLSKINATQGYTKADTQDLMASYAQRLRSENLTSVVATSDITENLARVIDSGLSGKVAEEFAYQATKLSAAVPTEDFFAYGDVYGSIVANSIAAGKSQTEALAEANRELTDFASNLLYASRQISSGIGTGLKDAHSLFMNAVQISQTSKSGLPSEIGGVLAAISATVGAVAPDLATSIVDLVVKSATGGNSSDIVALRSLAGINASNSEFLNALSSNPRRVFATLFSNLAEMKSSMSQTNYMEVAEGLSEVFGMSMDALNRVDFAYLADAINALDLSNAELNKNLNLLVSGETSLTSEQLRNQQINEYLLEEGLAYVLDNEVARSIQEHMWEEQLAREMQESTYAVELKGSALEFLEGIRQTIENLLSIFSPGMWFKKAVNLVGTMTESYAQSDDINKLLQLGKVGDGNYRDLHNLTTRNTDLNLVDSLVELMGGTSGYHLASSLRSGAARYGDITGFNLFTIVDDVNSLTQSAVALINSSSRSKDTSQISSSYDWKTVGKSVAAVLDQSRPTTYRSIHNSSNDSDVYSSKSTYSPVPKTTSIIEQLIDNIDSYKSYGDWESAARELGIVSIDEALGETGRSVNMIRDYYQAKSAKEASDDMVSRYADEQAYRDEGRTAWEEQKAFRDVTVPAFWDEERAIWESERLFRDVTLSSFWDEERSFWTDQRTVWESERTFRDVTLFNFWNEERAVWESERIFREETLPTRWTLEDEAWQRDADFYELAGGYLKTLDANLKSFYDEWIDYFVNFTAYSERYSFSDVEKIQSKEKDGQSAAIYALAQALTQNTVDLKDPTIQTNAILSQILILVNTIVQQTNENTSGAGSIAETLAGLALGLVK